MLAKTRLSFLTNLARENSLLKFVIIVQCIGWFVVSYYTIKAIKYQKTIIIPPGFHDKIVLEGEKVSESYLRAMASYVFRLALEYQPADVRTNYTIIKSLMTPRSARFYSENFEEFIREVEQGSITSVFFMKTLKVKGNMIVTEGVRNLYIDNDLVESKPISYAIIYRIFDGNFQVVEIGMLSDVDEYLKKTKDIPRK